MATAKPRGEQMDRDMAKGFLARRIKTHRGLSMGRVWEIGGDDGDGQSLAFLEHVHRHLEIFTAGKPHGRVERGTDSSKAWHKSSRV